MESPRTRAYSLQSEQHTYFIPRPVADAEETRVRGVGAGKGASQASAKQPHSTEGWRAPLSPEGGKMSPGLAQVGALLLLIVIKVFTRACSWTQESVISAESQASAVLSTLSEPPGRLLARQGSCLVSDPDLAHTEMTVSK